MKRTIIITDPCYIKNHSGINFLINRNTIYGDWSCMCYKGTKDEVKGLISDWSSYYSKYWHLYNFGDKTKIDTPEEFKEKKKNWISRNCYGEFCADSGMVCVAYLDEVLKSNPDFLEWMKEHIWCITIIPDFSGTIREEINSDELHIVGDSKETPFYTAQSGL